MRVEHVLCHGPTNPPSDERLHVEKLLALEPAVEEPGQMVAALRLVQRQLIQGVRGVFMPAS